MLHKTLLGLLLAPLLVLAAGCCANNPCDCNDSLADSLFIAFDPSFSKTELDTVFVTRTSRNGTTSTAPDVLPLPEATRRPTATVLAAQIDFDRQDPAGGAVITQNTNGLLVISNNAPFSQNTGTNLSSYSYLIRFPKDGSRTEFYVYSLDQIGLTGRYEADGCCTCYRNSQKLVRVTGGSKSSVRIQNVSDKEGANGRRVPAVIQLLK